jgi:hypothetical protein
MVAYNSGVWGAVSGAYCLSSSAGATTITPTFADGGNTYNVTFYEYSFSGLTVSKDTSAAANDGTWGTTHNGATLSLAGNNELIVRVGVETVSSSLTVASPYTDTTYLSAGGYAAVTADSINTSSGAGPQWTLGSGAVFMEGAIAFKLP